MAERSSSDSSLSLDSFVHLVASSADSHTTTPSSTLRESPSSWKQGIRQPPETMPHLQPHLFSYEPQVRKSNGPAIYKAPAFSAATQPMSAGIPRASTRGVAHKQAPYPAPSVGRQHQRQISPPNYFPRAPVNEAASTRNQSPYSIPLHSIGLGRNGECIYSLSLSLEELFTGKRCRFGITRSYISNKTKQVIIEIDIPPGCRAGTRILCRNVGHEWRPGNFQDIAFIVDEAGHDRFVRLFDDLVMDVRLPWVDSLQKQGGKIPFMGIDGKSLVVQIDYPKDKNMKGRSIIKGAGMPVRERGYVVGRGNLLVQWEILPRKTKLLHFVKRFFGSN